MSFRRSRVPAHRGTRSRLGAWQALRMMPREHWVPLCVAVALAVGTGVLIITR